MTSRPLRSCRAQVCRVQSNGWVPVLGPLRCAPCTTEGRRGVRRLGAVVKSCARLLL